MNKVKPHVGDAEGGFPQKLIGTMVYLTAFLYPQKPLKGYPNDSYLLMVQPNHIRVSNKLQRQPSTRAVVATAIERQK
jgi:hypothetical protein